MDLKDKIKEICIAKGLNKRTLSEKLDLNYVVFSRNVRNNTVTPDLLGALKSTFPDIDLNWLYSDVDKKISLVEETREKYEISDSTKLDQAIKLLQEVKKNLPL